MDNLIIRKATVEDADGKTKMLRSKEVVRMIKKLWGTNMIWIDKKAFKETYSILKQKISLKPVFADLKRFIEDIYSITVYNM